MGPLRESLKHPKWSKMTKIVTFLMLYAICQLTRFIYLHTLCRTIIAFIDLFIHSFIHFVGIIIVTFGQRPQERPIYDFSGQSFRPSNPPPRP